MIKNMQVNIKLKYNKLLLKCVILNKDKIQKNVIVLIEKEKELKLIIFIHHQPRIYKEFMVIMMLVGGNFVLLMVQVKDFQILMNVLAQQFQKQYVYHQ